MDRLRPFERLQVISVYKEQSIVFLSRFDSYIQEQTSILITVYIYTQVLFCGPFLNHKLMIIKETAYMSLNPSSSIQNESNPILVYFR